MDRPLISIELVRKILQRQKEANQGSILSVSRVRTYEQGSILLSVAGIQRLRPRVLASGNCSGWCSYGMADTQRRGDMRPKWLDAICSFHHWSR